MNYDAKKSWYIDIEITSYKGLAAAQAEYCFAALAQCIGAPPVDLDENPDWVADGKYGGVAYDTDEHHFHNIWLWCDEHADLPKILYIVAAMVEDGARVAPCCENAFTGTFDYHFNHCYEVGYKSKGGNAQ